MIDRNESAAAVCGVLLEKGAERLTARPRGLTRIDREKLQAQGVRFAGSPAVPVARASAEVMRERERLLAKQGAPKVAVEKVKRSSSAGHLRYVIGRKQLAARMEGRE